MANCKHGRLPDRCTECAVMADCDQAYAINALLRKELAIYKERGDKYYELAMYAYQRSSDALMMPANKPREARQAREQALCDINRKLGGAMR